MIVSLVSIHLLLGEMELRVGSNIMILKKKKYIAASHMAHVLVYIHC